MKKLLSLLLLLSVSWPSLILNTAAQSKPLAITHVTIIDATGAAAQPDMTVIVSGGNITALGKASQVRVPSGAEVVDATGKFLIPGLQDMHLHLAIIPDQEVSREIIVPTLVAFGITGARDMGGDWERIQQLRQEISAGKIIGPRIISPGPFVDGPQPPSKVVVPVSNEAEARQAVRNLKAQGVDFIKVQAQLSLETWKAVLDEAAKQNISVAGHIPERISAFDVARSKQRSVEHISPVLPGDAGVLMACSSKEAELRAEMLEIERLAGEPNADRQQLGRRQRAVQEQMVSTYDQAKCASLLSLFAKNQVWAVPTQVFGKKFAPLDPNDLPQDEALKLVPLSTRQRWDNRRTQIIKASAPENFAFRRAMFEKSRAVVGEMHRAGVKLMAGTDALDGYVVPGLSLHQELELMVGSGLTPMEALQTATRNPAIFLNRIKTSGTIERGKVADLVILDANPLQNISNTQRIHAVVLGGQLISPAKRQEIIDKIAAFASKH